MRELLFTKFGINTQAKGFYAFSIFILLYILSVFSDLLYATSTTASTYFKVLLLIAIAGSIPFLFTKRQVRSARYHTQTRENSHEEENHIIQSELVEEVFDLPTLQQTLESKGSAERGVKQKEFFKGQEGEYEQGDVFLGVNIADIVKLAEQYHPHLSVDDVQTLMASNVHDERIVGIWLLINKYQASTNGEQIDLFNFYIDNRTYVRNWNTVDLAARNIVGKHLQKYPETQTHIQDMLIETDSLWDTRTLVMSTDPFIEIGDTDYTFDIVSKLFDNDIELIQSGIGWVLKESYKYSPEETEAFLRDNFLQLSKQAIRIGTERMEKEHRKAFLRGEIS